MTYDELPLYQVRLMPFESCDDCPMGQRSAPVPMLDDSPKVLCRAWPTTMYVHGDWVNVDSDGNPSDDEVAGVFAHFERPKWCPLTEVEE